MSDNGTRRTMQHVVHVAALLLLMLGTAGCTKDNGPGLATGSGGTTGTGNTDFTGVAAAGATESGVITFSVASQSVTPSATGGSSPVGATGTLAIHGGTSAPLTGTFDPSNGVLTLAGGSYNISAVYAGGAMRGTYTGPANQIGNVVALTGLPASVSTLCGTYTGGNVSGTWDIVSSGNTVLGVTAGATSGGQLTGAVSGTGVSFMSTDGTSATGTFGSTTMSGTWTNGANTGTWTASTSGC